VAIKKAVKKAVAKVKSASPKKKTASAAGKKVATTKTVAKKKAPAKKSAPAKSPTRSPNIVKPQLAKKKVVGKPFPAKLQTTTKGNSTTISVAQKEVAVNEVVVEEKRLMMPPPPRPSINKNGKKVSSSKANQSRSSTACNVGFRELDSYMS
jgi:DnaK suppressor protein